MRHALERRGVLNAGLAAVLVGCSAPPSEPPPDQANLVVQLAPLALAGVTDVCYALAVASGDGEVVLARGPTATLLDAGRNPAASTWVNAGVLADSEPVCASRFGNGAGGDWSYVSPCDADAPSHTVTLWLESMTVLGQGALTPAVDYVDPCPTGCALPATCVENADTPVTFNITVMRRATQGFFDLGVGFDTVFCSAKLDCLDDAGAPLALLHHPGTGTRSETVVLALAGTGGQSGSDTVLLRDAVRVRCDAGELALDPTLGEGLVYGNALADPDPGDAVWQYATFFGQESLSCGAQSCQKVYWNVALGIDPASSGCTALTTATAGSSASLPAMTTPEGATWPIITFAVPLTAAGGGLVCTRHPLDGLPGGVETGYTDIDSAVTFDYRFDGVDFGGGDGFDPATVAFMEAIGIPADSTPYYAATPQATTGLGLWTALNTFVIGMKEQDLWDRVHALYPFIGGTEVAHAYNLIDPRDLAAAYRLTYTGSIAHGPTGYNPDAGGFADTHLSNAALPTDSVSMATYNREGGNSGFDISGSASPRTQLIAKYNNGNTYFDTNNSSNASLYASTHSGAGFYLSSRIVSTEVKLFIEGVVDRTLQSVSAPPQDVSFKLSKWQGGSIYSTRELSFVLIGEGYTDAEAVFLTDLVRALQEDLGRDVDPG